MPCPVADLSCPVFALCLLEVKLIHGFKAFNRQKQVLAKSSTVGIKYLDILVLSGPRSLVLKKIFLVKQDIPRRLEGYF